MNKPDRIPLRPDYSAAASPKVFWRDVSEKLHTKAATTASSSASSVLTPIGVAPLVTGIAPRSALMTLFARCTRVDMSGVDQVLFPRNDDLTAPIFVGEGSAHPVVQGATSSAQLGPACKLLFSAVISGEFFKYTPSGGAAIMEKALTDKVAKRLDIFGFDDTAATPRLRPAGLLNGVSDLGPTAGGGVAALVSDLAKFAGAISDAGIATDDLMFVANPRDAIRMRGLLSPLFAITYTIVESPAITEKTVVAIAPAAIVSGYSGEASVEISGQSAVHMEGATPLDITGASVATSVKSLWQSDLLAVRLRVRLAWTPLMAAAVQKIVSVSW